MYGYKGNLARLEQMRAELGMLSSLSVTNYSADGGHSIGDHSDPVARTAQRAIELQRKIASLAGRTEPIGRLLTDLKQPYVLEGSAEFDYLKLIRFFYFEKLPRESIAKQLRTDRRTIYNLRTKIVKKAIGYLGI